MSRQRGIKEFFPTDKDIESNSSPWTPSVSTASSNSGPPSSPPEDAVSAMSSTVGHASTSLATPGPAVTFLQFPTSLKRGASQTLEPERPIKRALRSGQTQEKAAYPQATNETINDNHDPPNGMQTIWAMTRGDLCESQSFFKAYEGGAHTKNKLIIGLYVGGAYMEPRDVLRGNKLITCSGGGRKQQNGKGKHVRGQTKPEAAYRMENSVGNLVAVVIGKTHSAFKDLNLPDDVRDKANFVELGPFWITRTWKEMVQPNEDEEPYPVFKVMLQTLDAVSKPWYWTETRQDAKTTNDRPQGPVNGPKKQTCSSCGRISPKIFDNAPWVCVDGDCEEAFKVHGAILGQTGDDEKELRYSEDFIHEVIPYEKPENIPHMFHPLPEAVVEGGDKYGTEAALRGGLTCPKCYCATARKYWDRVTCCNCGFKHNAAPLPYPLSLVEDETQAHTKKWVKAANGVTIDIDETYVEQFVEHEHDGMSTRFIFMIKLGKELVGTFVVERPSDAAKKIPGGADELYTSIEAEGGNMKFQRNPSRNPGSHAEQLTGHFQSNFGALYEFGPKGINTQAFRDAPNVVLESLVYLKHFGEKALKSSQEIASGEKYQSIAESTLYMAQNPFNELLALAYRESDQIGWHDDGEDQLTGVISTASFGSPGKMELRFKESGKFLKNYPALRDLKGKKILKVQLRHGDVVTMCDTRLQALTDHMVDPKGIRRYAMTSRTINFDHYRQTKQKAKLAKKGLTVEQLEEAAQLPDHALQFTYNGTTLGSHPEDAA